MTVYCAGGHVYQYRWMVFGLLLWGIPESMHIPDDKGWLLSTMRRLRLIALLDYCGHDDD